MNGLAITQSQLSTTVCIISITEKDLKNRGLSINCIPEELVSISGGHFSKTDQDPVVITVILLRDML